MSKISKEIAFLVLAAGKGTRMKNDLAKVMHPIAGKTMIAHVLDVTKNFKTKKLIPILSPDMKDVETFVKKNFPNSEVVHQKERLGTGHAVKICLNKLKNFNGVVVALYGDTPFIEPETVKKMIGMINDKVAVCVLGFETDQPSAYGRLVIDKKNDLKEIVEFKEASEAQKKIKFCNSGVMAFNGKHLSKIINSIKNNNSKKEYYLTDAVKIANDAGYTCKSFITDENEVIGVNSQTERADAEKIMQDKLRKKHLENGVIITAPETVFFSKDTEIASGVVVEPFVVFKGKVKIAEKCEIRSFSQLEDCVIKKNCVVGPYARIRPGTELDEGARIGNFVEVKKSKIGKGSKVNHLSYIGDTEMGKDVNVGAGTITCNYDGVNKHKTKIEDGAFIGSNSALVAPIKIGRNAVVGAGTTLTKDAAAGKITINKKEHKSLNKK
jgi:bifunctional UDP-N-acetylglucosamine pyrophosphorylase/glucosamine-1-phosphate N-acetyltransferase